MSRIAAQPSREKTAACTAAVAAATADAAPAVVLNAAVSLTAAAHAAAAWTNRDGFYGFFNSRLLWS